MSRVASVLKERHMDCEKTWIDVAARERASLLPMANWVFT